MRLNGQAALVVAAGAGIGRGISLALPREGGRAAVIFVDRGIVPLGPQGDPPAARTGK